MPPPHRNHQLSARLDPNARLPGAPPGNIGTIVWATCLGLLVVSLGIAFCIWRRRRKARHLRNAARTKRSWHGSSSGGGGGGGNSGESGGGGDGDGDGAGDYSGDCSGDYYSNREEYDADGNARWNPAVVRSAGVLGEDAEDGWRAWSNRWFSKAGWTVRTSMGKEPERLGGSVVVVAAAAAEDIPLERLGRSAC